MKSSSAVLSSWHPIRTSRTVIAAHSIAHLDSGRSRKLLTSSWARDSLTAAGNNHDESSRRKPVATMGTSEKQIASIVAEGVQVLERTPGVFRALLDGLGDEWTLADEGPDTWRPFDIVGHLIDGELHDWLPRINTILAGDPTATFEPFDRFSHLTTNADTSLGELLDRFERLRRDNLEKLRALGLDERAVQLEGRHPEFGAVTMEQLVATWVAHDLGHIAQTVRVMAKRHQVAVGPWRAYLPILDA